MGSDYTWFDTSQESRGAWEALCPPGEFRVINPNSVPPIIPKGLSERADSVLMVASGSPDGQILIMANIHRVDSGDQAIDQEPFGIVFHANSAAPSGVLLHHGKWKDRTTRPPEEFWRTLQSSGIGNCYPFSQLPHKKAGPITDLSVPSQHGAFAALVSRLKESLE